MPSGIQPSRAALFRRYVRLAIKNATAFRH